MFAPVSFGSIVELILLAGNQTLDGGKTEKNAEHMTAAEIGILVLPMRL